MRTFDSCYVNVIMADLAAPLTRRSGRLLLKVARFVVWGAVVLLGLIVVAGLAFFALHAANILGYPYPLDYGEGPLLAQVKLILGGMPFWRLYADPSAFPYQVVNYPPAYHLAAAVVALPLGDALLAGRVVSFLATLGVVAALWLLAVGTREPRSPRAITLAGLITLAALAVPIVREWAVVMRVDMLGVCLGLWALLVLQRTSGQQALAGAALLLALSLYVKPSLLAAPAAAAVWLFFRSPRRALLLTLSTAAIGALAFVALSLASGGWFATHVIAANTNEWQHALAANFWYEQLVVRWPLIAAAALALLVLALQPGGSARPGQAPALHLLPLYYTLFGALTALGVGKVGAYLNYFLEFYAGLIWLAAAGAAALVDRPAPGAGAHNHTVHLHTTLARLGAAAIVLLVCGSLLRYYPLWSEEYLKPYGMIEKQRPPRVAFGSYSVLHDLRRERAILAALARINAALTDEVRAAGAPIVTDVPGVAAQAGQLARLQAFEHRQLYATGHADQASLLLDINNGQVPLVVLDYLGNWLTPELIELVTSRYAQDGSRGTYDLYRPVALGPFHEVDAQFPHGLALTGYQVLQLSQRATYGPGETIVLALEWQRAGAATADQLEVVALLTDEAGVPLLETTRRLFYGALAPGSWPEQGALQHLQPIAIPLEMPARAYGLAVTLRAGGVDIAAPLQLTTITIADDAGRVVGEHGYFVPEPLYTAWEQAGGYVGWGEPLMPAVPFEQYVAQCFEYACVHLRGGSIARVPLGALVQLGETDLPAEQEPVLSDRFAQFYYANGDVERFGPPISGAFERRGAIVQYTRYARLEYPLDTTTAEVRLAPLGEEFLRLPGGGAYRWP